MFHTNMVCHLWDLIDEGLESVLDLLQGRVGITGVCTPLSTGPVQHLRFASGILPRVFHTQGGVCFHPDKACYQNTRCKPIVADWLKTRNPLDKLSRHCRDRRLELRAVIECTNVGRIAAHDDHFARKNVFNDTSPTQLCPVNADVAEFLRGLASDLSQNHSINTLELTGLDAAMPSTTDPCVELGVGGRQLLALCFCESCKQSAAAAGLDLEVVARSTIVRLESFFRTGQPIEPPLTDLAADDPPLAAFVAWYHERITALVAAIRDSCDARIFTHTPPLVSVEDFKVGAGIPRGADGVVCRYVGWETRPLERLIERMRDLLSHGQREEAQLSVCLRGTSNDQAMVRNITRVAEMGIGSANLEHYGCLPTDKIDLIKQAVRFARRTHEAHSSESEGPSEH